MQIKFDMIDIRNEIVLALEREIVGPAPSPDYLDEVTGEEILLARVHGSPQARYGAGILYPKRIPIDFPPDSNDPGGGEPLENENDVDLERPSEQNKDSASEESLEEEPVELANQYKPSAIGFTIRVSEREAHNPVTIAVKSAWYEKAHTPKPIKQRKISNETEKLYSKDSELPNHDASTNKVEETSNLSDYWIRRPLSIEHIVINIKYIFTADNKIFEQILVRNKEDKPWLKLNIYNRTSSFDKDEGFMTLTFTIINDIEISINSRNISDSVLFQNEIKLLTQNENLIVPYRERHSTVDIEEEKQMNLLYRGRRVYAIGHGTAVTWEKSEINGGEKIHEIKTSALPIYEMPQIAPTSHVEMSMYDLSDFGSWTKSKQYLESLVTGYTNWVNFINESTKSDPQLQAYIEAANKNVETCFLSLSRIKNGVEILCNASENSDIVKAFRWMNRAMLWQQQRSKTPTRKWQRTGNGFKLEGISSNNDNNHNIKSLLEYHNTGYGRWRPFQLAFILMNLESIINPNSAERDIVDLIWFPTGGGKTEAYLGLSAFTIFFRRLKGSSEYNWDNYNGTAVLMRYTLRLLTAQQFERASSLICACDLIRKENLNMLGPESISIGLWVGNTPNSNTEAIEDYNRLISENNSDYKFIVMKCPCCSAQIGKIEKPIQSIKIKGIKKEDGKSGKVMFMCDNEYCEYYEKILPLYVVDEYIYSNPPSLLLGTVDKFAMIPWKIEAGNIFGFRQLNSSQWERITPPELIIQDELHLISGQLGTIVGLYETMVQTLCNNYNLRNPPFISEEKFQNYISPKIVASSATISRAFEQVQGLYAIPEKNMLNIFPSQGLKFGDTWFSEEKPISELYPGRKYVGVLAPGYPSMQTAIVRAYASVLQKVGEIKDEEQIDYYWTLLGYFNSIRELGGASSLVYSDIRERLSQIQQRELTQKSKRRYINQNEELTSRISSSEIPTVLKKLEMRYQQQNNKALDICLATNMVATGLDVSRLGLMFIHGQPKTTSEYIQASSRVGRDVPRGAGLIITIYSPSKPRDKSQYEQFFSYHNRIYANVEPTSVTPFSINSRQRALHAVLIGLIRHLSKGPLRQSPRIVDSEFTLLTSLIEKIIHKRCAIVDPKELHFTTLSLKNLFKIWQNGFEVYGNPMNNNQQSTTPLMFSSNFDADESIKKRALPTPTSMRGVDTDSCIEIIHTF